MKHFFRIVFAGIASTCFSLGVAHAQDFASSYLALGLTPGSPGFSLFSVDSLGRGALSKSVILDSKSPSTGYRLEKEGNNRFEYFAKLPDGSESAIWRMEASDKHIVLKSDFVSGVNAAPFLLQMKHDSFATLLGTLQPGVLRTNVPCVLHLPGMGTFRITSSAKDAALDYDARRRSGGYVLVDFPAATENQKSVSYVLDVVQIRPDLPGVATNPLYEAYQRNFLNLIQFNPRLGTLANNSGSDSCGFCFYEYSELGLQAPPLASGLTVLDLVRVSVERVLNGGRTYGQVGYGKTKDYPDAVRWRSRSDSLDLAPSVLIAGCQYIEGSGDMTWAAANFDRLAAMGSKMLASDTSGDGLIKYPASGNSGSYGAGTRPSNWWDTIGFGYEDAYANALAYRACLLLSEVATKLNKGAQADRFSTAAQKIKAAYYPTFYDPQTGVLAGWKSADGKLHDYWFTFVNGMAISFGLVEDKEANAIMNALLHKMDEVGYTHFELGLPGNLIPIRKEDYLPGDKRWGTPTLEDGSDGFQIYENGGATACHTYWTIHALFKLKRTNDARRIFYPMLKSFAAGSFQARDANGMSHDWTDWQGNGHGYEGFLTDEYLALLAVKDDVEAGP